MRIVLLAILSLQAFFIVAHGQNAAPAVQKTVIYAEAGDTVSSLAARHGLNPDELAKHNGTLPSMKLKAGTKIFVPSTQAARPACSLSLDQAPIVRGLRLGMTRGEFYALLVPKARDPLLLDSYASGYMFLDREMYKDIQSVKPEFFEDRLYDLEIKYERDIVWKSDREFADRVSESLKLPNAWKLSAIGPGYSMDCGEFLIFTEANKLRLVDTAAVKAKMQYEKDKEELKKRTFKP